MKHADSAVWASGNAGLDGMFYGDSDGTDPTLLAAGSVDSAGDHLAQVRFAGSNGSSLNVTTSRFFPFPASLGPKRVYITSNNLCSGMPSDAPSNLGDYIVVCPQGDCDFSVKVANARNAAAIFFVNARDELNQPTGVNEYYYGAIRQSDGQALQGGTKSGLTYTATFPQDLVYVPRASAGRLSDFSATGPTYDMYFTTKLATPGYNVLAPYPDNRWTITSGTSFSSPLTAGAVALYLRAQADRGEKRDLQTIRDALFSTAAPVPYGQDGRESAASVGAGLVQVFNAINAGTKVTPSMLTLNDTEHLQATKYIVISNTDTKTNTYTLSHLPSSLLYGLDSVRKSPLVWTALISIDQAEDERLLQSGP
jgi:hypothetical protein